MRYGICYQGSKNAIAEDIINSLPRGRRLVDLFGGGFAISHCALTYGSHKFNSVLYNDVNEKLVDFIKTVCFNKEYLEKRRYEWIDRETFKQKKDEDMFIRLVWSFSNGGLEYLYGIDKEDYKKAQFYKEILSDDSLMKEWKKTHNYKSSRSVEFKGRFNSLEVLNKMMAVIIDDNKIEFSSIDYKDYEYRDGDVVYCDIPYFTENGLGKNLYNMKNIFNHREFIEWALSRPYPVFISHYENDIFKDFECIWEKMKVVLSYSSSNSIYRKECIYWNKKGKRPTPIQLTLF